MTPTTDATRWHCAYCSTDLGDNVVNPPANRAGQPLCVICAYNPYARMSPLLPVEKLRRITGWLDSSCENSNDLFTSILACELAFDAMLASGWDMYTDSIPDAGWEYLKQCAIPMGPPGNRATYPTAVKELAAIFDAHMREIYPNG